MVVLMANDEVGEPLIGPSAAERLAIIGVTRISLLRDGTALSVVLEGVRRQLGPRRREHALSGGQRRHPDVLRGRVGSRLIGPDGGEDLTEDNTTARVSKPSHHIKGGKEPKCGASFSLYP